MNTQDLTIFGSLFLLLFLYMGYLSWRNGNFGVIFTAPFANGGTEGVSIAVLAAACLRWYIEGWNTTFMILIISFAIVWYLVGRRIERFHNQLKETQ